MSKSPENIQVKKVHLLLLFIILPIITLAFIYGPTVLKAKNEYNAGWKDIQHLIKREDKQQYYNNTPNTTDHEIITSENELPNEPYLIIMYIHHCPLCEVSIPVINNYHNQLNEIHPHMDENKVVYVDMNTSFGKSLIDQYDIQKPTALILKTEDNHLVLYSGEKNNDEYIPTTGNIELAFKRLSRAIQNNQ